MKLYQFFIHLILATTAVFGKPGAHFQSGTSLTCGSDHSLVITFDEAGVGNTEVHIVASATAAAEWRCKNNGQNCPSAQNKQTSTTHPSNGGDFPVENGRVHGTLTLAPPNIAPPTFSCPGNMEIVLFAVDYTAITLCDETNGVCAVKLPKSVNCFDVNCP